MTPPPLRRGFAGRTTPPEEPDLYDPDFDALLIEQSIATQYGILPAVQGELPYPEWAKLVGGLMDDTPLGRVVAVRAENDQKVIARMSPWQRRIRARWSAHLARQAMTRTRPETLRAEMAALERAMAKLFGGDSHG